MKLYTTIMLIMLCTLAAGCLGNTKKVKKIERLNGASITYNLPDTRGLLNATFTLESCVQEPIASIGVEISAVSTPAAPNSQYRFTLTGSNLRSFLKDQEATISLHPNGAIKSSKTTVTDQTASIIGGFVKFLAFALAPGDNRATLKTANPQKACNRLTQTALAERDALRTQIASLRGQLPGGTKEVELSKRINVLATELARLQTGPLQIKLTKALPISVDRRGNRVIWKDNQFSKWIAKDRHGEGVTIDNKETDRFALNYCVFSPNEAMSDCTGGDIVAKFPNLPDQSVKCKGGVTCPRTIVFRDPVPAVLAVSVANDNEFVTKSGTPQPSENSISSVPLMVSQYGKLSYLPLSVGFGGKKTVDLQLNEFGQKTSFGWTSQAKGTGIVNGINTVADSVTSYRETTADPSQIEVMQSTISELETTQKLNKLEACRAILENGGYQCPE